MPKPTKGKRLGGSAAHQKLMLSNLATALFEHGRITTTETRARLLRPLAEKLITKAKRGDLHNRREVIKRIHDKSVVHTLFTEIGPSFADRPGGYTRITKIGPRKGDNAPMAIIELVTEAYSPKAPSTKKSNAAAAPAPAAEETEVVETEDATAEEHEAAAAEHEAAAAEHEAAAAEHEAAAEEHEAAAEATETDEAPAAESAEDDTKA